MNKFSHTNHAKLDAPERRQILPPAEILLETGLAEGMIMADIGAGTGYFSSPAADIVGENGVVYALDSSPEMLAMIVERYGVSTPAIRTVLTGENDFKLPEESVDYVLMSVVLHEVNDPALFIRNGYEILKKGGICVVIEWVNRETDRGPSLNERIDPDKILAMFNLAGFNEFSYTEYNNYFNLLIAVK